MWQPPCEGWVKCNVDTVFNNQQGTTNRGRCFRDGNGRFISAGTNWDSVTLSSVEAEALALKEA
ncbi:60S ribosomal protein L23, partial [Trifolium medium]|nr:60S ribosomal protein L23 [Trifolium medium]